MSGVAKKKDLKVDRRGELIEQNQDGLEYSSEEEVCLIFYVYGADMSIKIFFLLIEKKTRTFFCRIFII